MALEGMISTKLVEFIALVNSVLKSIHAFIVFLNITIQQWCITFFPGNIVIALEFVMLAVVGSC